MKSSYVKMASSALFMSVASEPMEKTDETEKPAGSDPKPEEEVPSAQALRIVEALLFAASEPLEEGRLLERLPEGADIGQVLRALQADYSARGVNLVRVGKGWAFRTASDLGDQATLANPSLAFYQHNSATSVLQTTGGEKQLLSLNVTAH